MTNDQGHKAMDKAMEGTDDSLSQGHLQIGNKVCVCEKRSDPLRPFDNPDPSS